MGWTELIVAFCVFLLSHAIPVRPPVKPWLVARLGQGGFTLAYSVLSLGVLVWVFGAAGRAPVVPLWPQMPILQGGAIVGMLVVCLGVALSIGVPNPFSFGGARNDRFDPARPGLIRTLRHPILAALALWAGLHMLPNHLLAGNDVIQLSFNELFGLTLGATQEVAGLPRNKADETHRYQILETTDLGLTVQWVSLLVIKCRLVVNPSLTQVCKTGCH